MIKMESEAKELRLVLNTGEYTNENGDTYIGYGFTAYRTDSRREIYKVDLRKSSSLFDSPAYYLQQNDVVYVYPNTVRAGQSTINENYFKSGSFWISLSSVAITVTNLILTLTLKR